MKGKNLPEVLQSTSVPASMFGPVDSLGVLPLARVQSNTSFCSFLHKHQPLFNVLSSKSQSPLIDIGFLLELFFIIFYYQVNPKLILQVIRRMIRLLFFLIGNSLFPSMHLSKELLSCFYICFHACVMCCSKLFQHSTLL
jgi:hypothetical protein